MEMKYIHQNAWKLSAEGIEREPSTKSRKLFTTDYYRLHTKYVEGDVFTGVCHSVYRGSVHPGCTPCMYLLDSPLGCTPWIYPLLDVPPPGFATRALPQMHPYSLDAPSRCTPPPPVDPLDAHISLGWVVLSIACVPVWTSHELISVNANITPKPNVCPYYTQEQKHTEHKGKKSALSDVFLD